MRKTLLAAAALVPAVAPLAGCTTTPSQTQGPTAMTMQPGQRMQLGPMVGQRSVREVMVSQGGAGLTVVYDMVPGQPQRVLRLENVNGMLEVIYGTAMPSTMALGSGGTPRLAQKGGGMYSVEYGR